jgi:hypothetical protein
LKEQKLNNKMKAYFGNFIFLDFNFKVVQFRGKNV